MSFDMPTTSPSGILGVGGSPPPIPPVSAVVSIPEVMAALDHFKLLIDSFHGNTRAAANHPL